MQGKDGAGGQTPASGAEPLVMAPVQARAFEDCLAVGLDGLVDVARDRVEAVLANAAGSASKVYSVPGEALDDVRAAFAVGWEGLGDGESGPADEVAAMLGVSLAVSPSP